mmetsp:Transcript_166316/g.528396  ORF Transcript_166316/g.528396 Transcript_166316/m.528396 type:complete len:118 (-) Transcript_166316:51-404(-)
MVRAASRGCIAWVFLLAAPDVCSTGLEDSGASATGHRGSGVVGIVGFPRCGTTALLHSLEEVLGFRCCCGAQVSTGGEMTQVQALDTAWLDRTRFNAFKNPDFIYDIDLITWLDIAD